LEKLSEVPGHREKKDWMGWKVVPRPDLKNPLTGEPIVFPHPWRTGRSTAGLYSLLHLTRLLLIPQLASTYELK
jgi:hypothetical protein